MVEWKDFINTLIAAQIPAKIFSFQSFFIIWVFILKALPIQGPVWHIVLYVRDFVVVVIISSI